LFSLIYDLSKFNQYANCPTTVNKHLKRTLHF